MAAVVEFIGRGERRAVAPTQLELFGQANAAGFVAFLDNDKVTASAFLRIISKHSARTIVDCRRQKMLSPYAGEHKFVADYIELHKLNYIDVSYCNSEMEVNLVSSRARALISSGLSCILFRSSEDASLVRHVRWALFNLAGARAEIPSQHL